MEHINHIRPLYHVSRMSLRDTMSYGNYNFATFGGSFYQRNQVALNTMANFCGNMGVVLLHNNPQLECLLGNIYSISSLLANNSSFQMILANKVNDYGDIDAFYDPLYGLSETEVLDVISPLPDNDRLNSDILDLRSIITAYLNIVEFQFNLNRSAFGDYPFNLDLLLQLTNMPYAVLEEQVLNYLPHSIISDISNRLKAPLAQQRAYSAILAFAQAMKSSLWRNRGFGNHTKVSIISAVQNKHLISIYIPESRTDILDYIYSELQHLNKVKTPYLLVESGLDLSSDLKLKKLFLSEHNTLSYYTGIIAEDTSSIISTLNSNTELAALFSQTQEMYIFACSSSQSAQPFSDGIGSYVRQLKEHHHEAHKETFHIIGAHGHGAVEREISQKTVNPEELVNLGNGCLLYGRNHPIPVLVDNFTL